jgi:hypothetical protein
VSCDEWTLLANALMTAGIIFCVIFTVTFLIMRVVYWATRDEWPK